MRLVVFFSRGMSLEGWRRAGILERELALYRRLRPMLDSLAFVTYGGAGDVAIGREVIPEVEILANLRGHSANRYSLTAVWAHRRALRAATVLKTNQINGAWTAVLASWIFRKSLVVRCGFLWADVVKKLGASAMQQWLARRLERRAFRTADRVIVAAAADKTRICDQYHVDPRRVVVIPNYVDVDLFRPTPEVPRDLTRVISIGRLDDQKNLAALIEAMVGLDGVTLTLVGDGPLRHELGALAEQRGVTVEFLGTRPHPELPRLLSQSGVFALVSNYEGNPKALVEAMASGIPVIGTRAPGIQEILDHGVTGYLCGTSATEIHRALVDVLADDALRQRIAEGAVRYVRSTCSLDNALTAERRLLDELTGSAAHV